MCVLRLWHISGAYRRWPWFFFVELPRRCVTLRQQCFRQQQLCFFDAPPPFPRPPDFYWLVYIWYFLEFVCGFESSCCDVGHDALVFKLLFDHVSSTHTVRALSW